MHAVVADFRRIGLAFLYPGPLSNRAEIPLHNEASALVYSKS